MKQKIRMIAVLSAFAVSVAFAEKPWLIVNEDNDHYFKNPSYLMTEEALKDYIDYTCRGAVTHFFMCPSEQRASSLVLNISWSRTARTNG